MKRGLFTAFWRLARPFWVSDERWKARGLFAAIVALNLGIVWVNVRLNRWNGAFYDALQDKRYDDFKGLLLQFAGWAFLYIVMAVYQLYLTQMLQIRWRRWLTDVHLARWLGEHAHYRMSLADAGTDNPDQRIAEDLRLFVSDSLALFFGLLSSVVSFVSFVGILWALSGPMTIAGVPIPGYLVWAAIVYAVAGSVLAHRIGRPLVRLSFDQQRYEADFRFALVRARENAEGIALYRGEDDELAGLRQRFGNVVRNWWHIMSRQKRYTWFSSFYGQAAIIFPFLVAAPRYFAGEIALGGLMRIANAFGEVQKALSWLVDAYVRIADWRASVERLDGFLDAIERARTLGDALQIRDADAVELDDTHVAVPDAAGGARALIRTRGERIAPGEHTMISGASGSGKSTLFRVVSGIWPFAQGSIARPDPAHTLFLPQKPYLPLGTLRDCVTYPRQSRSVDDAAIRRALDDVNLAPLASRLDEVASWSQVLSLGEQQRLAIARALIVAPRWLFLDEATSALDEANEAAMYRLLRERLAGTTRVSIAHRESLGRFHDRVWRLQATAPGRAGLLTQHAAAASDA